IYKNEISKILINHFMDTKDYYNASQVLESMIFIKQSEENQRNIFHNYILCLKELKRYDEAIDFFNKNVNFFDRAIYEMISDIYYEKNQKQQALEMLKKIFYNGKTLIILKKMVTILLEQNKITDAIKILENEGRDLDLDLLLSELYYKDKRMENSFEIMSKININKFRNSNLILFFKVCLELDKIDYIKKYINHLDKLMILTASERENILYKLGEIFYNENDFKNANTIFARYLKEFQSGSFYEKMLFMYGVSLKNDKRYSDAIVEFSKIQKTGKKDEVYFESFVEKGEIHFTLQEYKNAIDNYKQYLANKNFDRRKKEVLLQLGNSFFNIKNYKFAYDTYKKYLNDYEDTEQIQNKIAYSLLKDDNYAEILKYFGNKSKTYDFQKYLIILSHYKLKQFEKTIQISSELLKNNKAKYFYDLAYLNVMSRIETNYYNEIDNLYQMVTNELKTNDEKTLT
ncbi:MAG TPA: tetratricopeptide repeat protein, partial [Spirochaetota bacterium]|nr:tetratricopeptide repeat protein [Spirochaetota bacterium]